MILPSERTICETTSSYRCTAGLSESRIAFLEDQTDRIPQSQRVFVLQFDEIHVQQKLELKNGTVSQLLSMTLLQVSNQFSSYTGMHPTRVMFHMIFVH